MKIIKSFLIVLTLLVFCLTNSGVASAATSYSNSIKGKTGTIGFKASINWNTDREWDYYSFATDVSFTPKNRSAYKSDAFYIHMNTNNSNAIIFDAKPENTTSGQPYNVTIGFPGSVSVSVDANNNLINAEKDWDDPEHDCTWEGTIREGWYPTQISCSFKPCFVVRVPKGTKDMYFASIYLQYQVHDGIWGTKSYVYGTYSMSLKKGKVVMKRI